MMTPATLYKIIWAGSFLISPGCKKELDLPSRKVTATELLTNKPWQLESLGFDDNGNNFIDPPEESIEECQKDNGLHYYADGTGLFDDNTLSCANGIGKEPFSWKFTDHERRIDLFYDTVNILRLDEKKLILYKELTYSNGQSLKFIMSYRH